MGLQPEPLTEHFRGIPGQVTRGVKQNRRPVQDSIDALLTGTADAEERALLERCRLACALDVLADAAVRRHLSWREILAERKNLPAASVARIAAKRLEADCRAFRRAIPLLGRMGRRGWLALLLLCACAAAAALSLR